VIFRQLFEPLSSTYTYLLGCPDTGDALLIDPVVNAIERDIAELARLGLRLVYTVDTHVHADHITGALQLKQRIGSKIAAPAMERLPCVDIPLEDSRPLNAGGIELMPMHTPGHTDGHFAYVSADRVFTGDALLIDGCGRTDFQNGDSVALYRSVRERLFCLPDDQLVYPGHDYNQRRVSTIGQERRRNPRLGGDRKLEDFVSLMAALKLPYPKFIDHAVPGNRLCGVCPTDMPEQLQAYCREMSDSSQG
jgi:glyoxylase-like metal-dependent hydrolase (beta-lactamase superfamily II)